MTLLETHPWIPARKPFCASFSLQASVKPMASKLIFLLSPNQMKNLSICKQVLSTFSPPFQPAAAQQGRGEMCHQGLCTPHAGYSLNEASPADGQAFS